MKEKLILKIGYKHDKYGNTIYDAIGNPIPIYKTIKKLKVMYISKKHVVSFHWVKPFKQSEYWYYKLGRQIYVIPDVDNMIMWTPRVGKTPIVITQRIDIKKVIKPKGGKK